MTSLQDFQRKRPPNREAVEAHKARLLQELHTYRLRELREALNLTQTDLAGILNVTQNRVSNIERGNIDRIQVDTLRRYIEALGAHLRIAVDIGDGTLLLLTGEPRYSAEAILELGQLLSERDSGPEDVTPRVYSRGGSPPRTPSGSRNEPSRRQATATSKKDASLAGKQLANPRATKAQKSVAASDLAQAKKMGGKKS
jgi:transcriptional regulator with XRE-family HTH domain